MNLAISLGPKQVVQIIQLGSSTVLSILQEETIDYELGVTYPAKSFTVDSPEGLSNLRDLLNKVLPWEGKKDEPICRDVS